MAKYLKSFFTSTEKKKRTIVYEAEFDDGEPPMGCRRKLSISRSGRLKQANRKRHSLSMELYGENYQPVERPKTVEYHVNNPTMPEVINNATDRRRSVDAKVSETDKPRTLNPTEVDRPSTDARMLDTEIDNAFKVIDKT